MKNTFNILVTFLVLVSLAMSGYRVYKIYQRVMNHQEDSHRRVK